MYTYCRIGIATIIVLVSALPCARAQIIVRLTTTDSLDVPVRDVIVTAYTAHWDSILTVAITDVDGTTTLTLPSSEGVDAPWIVLGHMLYDTDTLQIQRGQHQYKIGLRQRKFQLQEVIVKEVKPIITYRQDTLIFDMQQVRDGTEYTVEELMEKIPGLEIDRKGRISFQGKVVGTVLVDGDDLFGSDYVRGTRNMRAHFVEGVELINGYTRNPLYAQLDISEELALNLKTNIGLALAGSIFTELGIKDSARLAAQMNTNQFLFASKSKHALLGSVSNISTQGLSQHHSVNGSDQARPSMPSAQWNNSSPPHQLSSIPESTHPFGNRWNADYLGILPVAQQRVTFRTNANSDRLHTEESTLFELRDATTPYSRSWSNRQISAQHKYGIEGESLILHKDGQRSLWWAGQLKWHQQNTRQDMTDVLSYRDTSVHNILQWEEHNQLFGIGLLAQYSHLINPNKLEEHTWEFSRGIEDDRINLGSPTQEALRLMVDSLYWQPQHERLGISWQYKLYNTRSKRIDWQLSILTAYQQQHMDSIADNSSQNNDHHESLDKMTISGDVNLTVRLAKFWSWHQTLQLSGVHQKAKSFDVPHYGRYLLMQRLQFKPRPSKIISLFLMTRSQALDFDQWVSWYNINNYRQIQTNVETWQMRTSTSITFNYTNQQSLRNSDTHVGLSYSRESPTLAIGWISLGAVERLQFYWADHTTEASGIVSGNKTWSKIGLSAGGNLQVEYTQQETMFLENPIELQQWQTSSKVQLTKHSKLNKCVLKISNQLILQHNNQQSNSTLWQESAADLLLTINKWKTRYQVIYQSMLSQELVARSLWSIGYHMSYDAFTINKRKSSFTFAVALPLQRQSLRSSLSDIARSTSTLTTNQYLVKLGIDIGF